MRASAGTITRKRTTRWCSRDRGSRVSIPHKVRQQKGCLLTQVLQSGNEIVGITSWETEADLATYADGEVARELFTRITPLFMGMPTARSYEVKVNLWEPAATKRS